MFGCFGVIFRGREKNTNERPGQNPSTESAQTAQNHDVSSDVHRVPFIRDALPDLDSLPVCLTIIGGDASGKLLHQNARARSFYYCPERPDNDEESETSAAVDFLLHLFHLQSDPGKMLEVS